MPMTHSIEELFYPKSYFFYFNQKTGKEIYTMAEEEIWRRYKQIWGIVRESGRNRKGDW